VSESCDSFKRFTRFVHRHFLLLLLLAYALAALMPSLGVAARDVTFMRLTFVLFHRQWHKLPLRGSDTSLSGVGQGCLLQVEIPLATAVTRLRHL